MKANKISVLLLSCALMLGTLAGCGQSAELIGDNSASSENGIHTPATSEAKPISEEEPTDNTKSKMLVVYYSASGNTAAVSTTIANAMNADIFEIVPAEIYTREDLNYSNPDSRVSIEHDNIDQRTIELVSTTVENWDSYDTVYIGYPIWWGIAAWPIDGFVKANDFTGKTVVPFCTAVSSDIGESGTLLAELSDTGSWIQGECFRSSTAEDDIIEWAKSIIE